MPTFGNLGKSSNPPAQCPNHPEYNLAVCRCEYARQWREDRQKRGSSDLSAFRSELLEITIQLVELYARMGEAGLSPSERQR